jgi:hypothetical protein
MKKKNFDCVQMKHDIQQRLMDELKGLSYEEQWAITEKRILANPILGPFWKNANIFTPPGQENERGTERSEAESERTGRQR